MPDVIWIIVTVQTVPGLKYLVDLAHHWYRADRGKPADQQYIPEDFHQLFSRSVWRLLVDRPGAESRYVPRSSDEREPVVESGCLAHRQRRAPAGRG